MNLTGQTFYHGSAAESVLPTFGFGDDHHDYGRGFYLTDELMAWYLKESGYQPKPGAPMQGFMPDWIGRFYAYYQWDQRKSSRETLAAVPLDFLKVAYHGLHDLDLNLAVSKVAGRDLPLGH